MGTPFPSLPPFPGTHHGFHHLYSSHMLYLAYITVSLLARLKCVTTKICEIKIGKSTTTCRLPNAIDPAKRGTKRVRIRPAVSGFRTEQSQLSIRDRPNCLFGNTRLPFWEQARDFPFGNKPMTSLLGTRDFLFGNMRLPLLAPGLAPFALRLGATQWTRGLALTGMYCTNTYLGYKTLFGSPGTCPGTTPPGFRGWGNDPITTRATGEQLFRYLVDLFY